MYSRCTFLVDDDDKIDCRWIGGEAQPVEVEIGAAIFRIDLAHLETLVGIASQVLHERRPAPVARCCRFRPVPAEAVVDADDLLAAMAESFDVRMTVEEQEALERARHFAPEEVP